jgi:hypothetical protein
MSFRRYEILLPTRYNDGTSVEAEKFDLVIEELSNRFGGITFHPEQLRGVWFHQGQKFEEVNVRVVVDVEDSAQAADFFARYKQVLKERFRQIDIWIVSQEIRIT